MGTTTFPAGRPRSGFTLVEVLTVIVILSILAALTVGAVMMARTAARRAAIRVEISQLETALENYKREYGEYPPDFAGLDGSAAAKEAAQKRVISHLRKRFPRYGLTGDVTTDWNTFHNAVAMATSSGSVPLEVNSFTPSTALAFWLGGLPDNTDQTILTGFSADPAHPFESSTVVPSRVAPLMEFRADQLHVTTGGVEFRPSPSGLTAPYVYFKAWSSGGYYPDNTPAEPYYDSGKNVWLNPKTFQIISAGLDDGYGAPLTSTGVAPHFPSGDNFDESDSAVTQYGSHYDNQTNFAKGTLEDEMQP